MVLLISQKSGMANSINWAEALEEFNFDTETFTNHEYCYVEPSEYNDWDIEHPENIPVFNHGVTYMDTIKWEDAFAACEWFNSLERFEGYSLGKDLETGCVVFSTE